MKKWLKTKNAFIFRLNNRIVQTKFVDNSELILSSEQKIVTYINTKGEKFRYMLSNALEEKNPEMVKRLKYTKEVLTHLANGG